MPERDQTLQRQKHPMDAMMKIEYMLIRIMQTS